MGKKFICIRNNAAFAEEDDKRTYLPDDDTISAVEIVPVDCLLKIYKHCPSTFDNVLIYEWIDPILHTRRTFRENCINPMRLESRLKYLEKVLSHG